MTQLVNIGSKVSYRETASKHCTLPVAQHVATSLRETMKLIGSEQKGLTAEQVHIRQQRYGYNEASRHQSPSWIKLIFQAVHNPFIYVLLGLMFASLFLDYWLPLTKGEETDLTSVLIMTTMIVVSVALRFTQEYRTNKISDSLKNLIKTDCQVIRQDAEGRSLVQSLPRHSLVPGDIIRLRAGDVVPADVRLLTSTTLQINQSVLTGESAAVEKMARQGSRDDLLELSDSQVLNQSAVCLMGTSVISGAGCAVVVATGGDTWFGKLASTLSDTPVKTAFDKGVNQVSWLLIRFMVCMVPLVFLFNGITKGQWLDSLFVALAVAVGLTPEMLPMIVTTNLAIGARKLARKKVVIKRLSAIQNLGAMNVLCTDKTGTLTEDTTILHQALDLDGNYSDNLVGLSWLNSSLQTGFNSPMDQAILKYAQQHLMTPANSSYRKVAELPFDFHRRCLSVAVSINDQLTLITKGAAEEMLMRCAWVQQQGSPQPLTSQWTQQISQQIADYNRQGYRVLLLGTKILTEQDLEDEENLRADVESRLTLSGLLLFMDPLKEGARQALSTLKAHGVEVKVLTGDTAEIADKVCRDLGFSHEKPLIGSQIESMDDETLKQHLATKNVFARLTPHDKQRIVSLLQQQGHTTGFLGDGVNDAAAIQAADIGLSVDNATDVARQAADMILLEKDLRCVVDGVRYGRHTFANIIKYLNITASSNFGNVFSVLFASLFIPFMPMMAIQLLFLNLIYDLSQLALPWDRVDEEQIRKPGQWNASNIGKIMLVMGPLSSIFDVATYAVMWYVFGANSESSQALFQSGWFVESLISQTLVVHLLRTAKTPFIQSLASWPLTVSTLLVVIIGVVLPYSPFASSLNLLALPASYFVWLVAIIGGYCQLSQKVKNGYIRRYGQWF